MKTLPKTVLGRMEAAEAWLDLGDWRSANEELEALPPELRSHPRALGLRARVYALAGKHEVALEIGEQLAAAKVADAELLLALARCCCAIGRPADARGWLARAFEVNDSPAFRLRALDDPVLGQAWTAADA
jgi:tetratricopeptide (TPR) repeat protein